MPTERVRAVSELFLKILDMSLSASWLVLAVLIARLVLRKAPKWVNVVLWGLVAVRLLCPFTLESRLSRLPDNNAMLNEWTDDYVGDFEIIHDNRAEFQTAVKAGRTPLYAGEDGYYVVTAPDKVSAPRTVGNTVVPLLSIVWIVGMAAMGEYTLFTYLRLKQRVKLAIKVTEDIFLSEFVDSPFVLGLLRPRIYLPYHMHEQDSHHVIAHERMHIQRKDHWWKPLGFCLLSIHWFNPVLWLAYCLLCRDIEMACDEKVVQKLDTQQRADYSQALLNCSVHHKQIAACPLAFGEAGVKERITNVLHYRKPAVWVILIAAVVCTVVAVCFLTDPVEERGIIEDIYNQNGYRILDQTDAAISISIPKYDFPADCYTTGGHTFPENQHISSQNNGSTIYIRHMAYADESKEYLQFTFAFDYDPQNNRILLPYKLVVTDGNVSGIQHSMFLPSNTVSDINTDYEDACYYHGQGAGEIFTVNVKTEVWEDASEHISFTVGGFQWVTYERTSTHWEDNLSVSFAALEDANIEKVKLVNMHNGTISWIMDAEDVDSIVAFLQGISGHNGISSRGYYEGSYSVTLVSAEGEETHIGFGDTSVFNYGDYGDGYPVRYQLEDLSIAAVTEFFGQYDISNAGIAAGISLDVESVSPTGATVVFRFGTEAPLPEWLLMGGNDYHIQRKAENRWIDVEPLTQAVFTTEAYDITNIRRHSIDWEWLYGTLPAGEYRIGKSVTLQRGVGDTESGTVYGEFTIAGNTDDWNLRLDLGWFTASGIHCEVNVSDPEGEFYYYGAGLYPDQAGAARYTAATEASAGPQNLLENPEVTILWQDALPSGKYRADIQILHVTPSGEEEIHTYSVHLGISEESSYMSPLVVTQKLNADGFRGTAEYLNAGGGYNFFEDMTAEIISILKELTSEEILPAPGIIPDTVITLRSQELSIILHSDGEYVEFSFEGEEAVTIGNGVWAVKNQALNAFFTMMNSYSPENSTYEIYNVAPLNELPPHYSMEEAAIDNVVVTQHGMVMDNSEVWAEFWDDTQHQIPAAVRCMNVSEGGKDIYDIEFDGEEYHYRIMRGGELWDISYRHLLFFNGDAPENAEYDAYEYFVLVNDASVTWEQIQRSYISSQSADEVDHRIVHWHHIYYPKQPRLPEIAQAELVVNGESIVLITDEKTVYEIHRLINGAEWLGFDPATYFLGPKLMLLGADGSAYTVELDVTDDLCRIGGRFYDYGPGMDGDASINNLPRLLNLLGLEDWPESVKELHPYLWE